jgi:hypothetical protein
MALRIARTLPDFAFHLGYQQFYIPKCIRKLLAKSEYHRAWHSGFYGGGILSVMERCH